MPIARTTSMQWLNAEEVCHLFSEEVAKRFINILYIQRYLNWINRQLLPATGSQIGDIEESLANGVLIIKAIAVSVWCVWCVWCVVCGW